MVTTAVVPIRKGRSASGGPRRLLHRNG